jgi:hypothetical protein
MTVYLLLSRDFLERFLVKEVCIGAVDCGTVPFRFPVESLGFFSDLILLATLCPWGRNSACTRNECQGYLPGGNSGLCGVDGLTTFIC